MLCEKRKHVSLRCAIGGAVLALSLAASPLPSLATEVRVPDEGTSATSADERAWYGTSCAFTGIWTSPKHYYDGASVGVEMNASCSKTTSFIVRLFRNNSFIGSKTVTANGFARATWEDIGAGNCYFQFVNTSGSRITCSNIAMFSW